MILLHLITSILFQKLNDQELVSEGMNTKMFNQTCTDTEAEGNYLELVARDTPTHSVLQALVFLPLLIHQPLFFLHNMDDSQLHRTKFRPSTRMGQLHLTVLETIVVPLFEKKLYYLVLTMKADPHILNFLLSSIVS